MRNALIFSLTIVVSTAIAYAQDEAPEGGASERESAPDGRDDVLEKTVVLRDRVRDMRRSVLGGGPAVEKAEKEALDFYRRKIRESARRGDELRTRRDSRMAEYDLALEATLQSEDEEDAERAAREASGIRAEIASVDAEIADLERERNAYGQAFSVLQARIERRRTLLARFDEPSVLETLPFLGADVLGAEEDGELGGDPFSDEELITDLLRKDPERGRALFLTRNPDRYWELFPLTPPEEALREALAFPPADLPGRR